MIYMYNSKVLVEQLLVNYNNYIKYHCPNFANLTPGAAELIVDQFVIDAIYEYATYSPSVIYIQLGLSDNAISKRVDAIEIISRYSHVCNRQHGIVDPDFYEEVFLPLDNNLTDKVEVMIERLNCHGYVRLIRKGELRYLGKA